MANQEKIVADFIATIDRRDILLRAAYDLLQKQHNSGIVLNLLEETAHWDGQDCDGYCLREEIMDLLDID